MVKSQKIINGFTFLLCLLWLHGSLVFAGQGCCSTHGGAAGCAGGKLQCNDGTLSATCGCRDDSTTGQLMPRAQDGLALLEPMPQDAKPYVMPIAEPSPVALIDTVPSAQGNKPYVTPAVQPQSSTQGDAVPSQEPPGLYSSQGDQAKKNVGQYKSPPPELPAFPGAVRDKPKTSFAGGKRARWRTSEGDILEWDYQHGKIEKYNKRGKHKGEYDPNTGQQTKPAESGRQIEP